MNNSDFKDTRILEAFDYIDPKYIAEVAESLKLRSVRTTTEAPEMTWRTPFKHWKQFVALAACLLLLAFASPVFNKVAEVISSFAAGWGIGTETLDTPETTNGMYDEYILTEEDLAQLNEANFKRAVLEDPNYVNADESYLDELRNNKYFKFAQSVEHAMDRSTRPGRRFYFGKYGDCIVIVTNAEAGVSSGRSYVLGEYKISFYASTMLVCYDSTFYTPNKAYEMGLLSDSDTEKIYQIYLQYYCGGNSNETNN